MQVQSQEELADGGSLFQWLISPVDADSFEEEVEERQPLMVARPANRGYYGGLFSKAGAWAGGLAAYLGEQPLGLMGCVESICDGEGIDMGLQQHCFPRCGRSCCLQRSTACCGPGGCSTSSTWTL